MSIHLDPETLGRVSAPQPSPSVPVVAAPPVGVARRTGRAALSLVKLSTLAVPLLLVGAFLLERFAPIDWRPSSWLGGFGGRRDAAHVLTAIEARRAEAAVLNEEQARAQQEIIALQAANERVSTAYRALYDRGSAQAQAWAAAAKEALLLETQNRVASLKGRTGNSSMKDTVAMFCDLGALVSPDITCGDPLRESAKAERDAMTAEIVANFQRQSLVIAASLKDWSQGLPDPAELVAAQHRVGAVTAAPRAPTPPAPLD